jgi:hypothetical protein
MFDPYTRYLAYLADTYRSNYLCLDDIYPGIISRNYDDSFWVNDHISLTWNEVKTTGWFPAYFNHHCSEGENSEVVIIYYG